VWAAGVLRNVAAERAGLLARRIGRVEEAVSRDRLREIRVHDAGLHDRDAVLGVDAQYTIHARALDHDAAIARDRAAREPRAGTARHERHAVPATRAHHALHFLRAARQHHRAGPRGVMCQAVGLVDEQLLLAREHAAVPGDRSQLSE